MNLLSFDFFNQLLQLHSHLICDDRKAVLEVPWQVFWKSGQFAHQNHEVFLNWQQVFTKKIVGRGGTRKTNGRIQLIYRPVSLHTRMTFGDTPIVHQPSSAHVSSFSNDAHARW